jgi:hypothetical protein
MISCCGFVSHIRFSIRAFRFPIAVAACGMFVYKSEDPLCLKTHERPLDSHSCFRQSVGKNYVLRMVPILIRRARACHVDDDSSIEEDNDRLTFCCQSMTTTENEAVVETST